MLNSNNLGLLHVYRRESLLCIMNCLEPLDVCTYKVYTLAGFATFTFSGWEQKVRFTVEHALRVIVGMAQCPSKNG